MRELISQKFIVREISPEARIFEATLDTTEDCGKYVATILINPDGGAVVASHKVFDTLILAHEYLISELHNHAWFEYVKEAPKERMR